MRLEDLVGHLFSDTGEEDMHTHKCINCCTEWSHSDATARAPREEFTRAHQCPKCHLQHPDLRIKYDAEFEREMMSKGFGGSPWSRCAHQERRIPARWEPFTP